MNIKEFVQKEKDKLIKNELYIWGGRSDVNVLIRVLNKVAKMTTGISEPKIWFKPESNYSSHSWFDNEKNELHLYYNLSNGGEYQYNQAIIKDYKIQSIDGNAHNYIIKIFDFISILDEEIVEKYDLIMKVVNQVDETLKRDEEENKSDHWFKHINNHLDEKTLSKIKKLNVLHQGLLLSYSNEELSNILNIIYPVWEIEKFNIIYKGFLDSDSYVEGSFSDMSMPKIDMENKKDFIVFPRGGRGSLCSEFIVVRNIEDMAVEENDIIKLKNLRKGSKVKEYKFLEKSCDGYIAVKNLQNNIIEFLVGIDVVESAYDALFTCNRIEFRGWFNKRVDYISV